MAVEKHDDSIITEEMKAICNVVFRAVLAFCVSMLQIDSDANFPDSETNSIEDIFCTLLYNDETHTFDQVRSYHTYLMTLHGLYYGLTRLSQLLLQL